MRPEMDDLSGLDVGLLLAAVATGAMWLLAAGVVYLLRKPPEPPVGPRTLELGPEPPAVANFLVHDWRVTDDAVPATLIDLAARNVVDVEQRGPGVFSVRLRAATAEQLTPYERRVLDHLRGLAHDDVVPAEALTTGPGIESKRWRRGFEGEVVADAQARGVSRDAVGGRIFTILLVAAAVPAALVWALSEIEAGGVVLVGAGLILAWIRERHPQRETPAGLEAASRWLGVRAELTENEVFRTHSPLTVELWSRLLAYGAALGVASGASRPLPMGAESDTHAWSSYGGRWRPVRISYPRVWPIGWGLDPAVGAAAGLGAALAGSLALYFVGPTLADALGDGWWSLIPGLLLIVPAVAVVVGVALAIMAARDLTSMLEVTAPIVRLRTFGDDDDRRYYVGVDDGGSRSIRAFRVRPAVYAGLEQGEVVTVRHTGNLGCVRWILRADAAPTGH
jgi:Predicted membrane protein (DUF2207)